VSTSSVRADRGFRRYVALGDSFTEGLNDHLGADGRHRGWADRFAEELDRRYPGLHYANMAVRGKLIGQVVAEQVPTAVALQPDLVTFAAGVNDALRRSFDLDECVEQLTEGVVALRRTGALVVVFAFGDPSRRSSVMGTVSQRLRAYNEATVEVAERHGAQVVDFWGAAVFDDDEFWSADRLHLSPAGHALAARAALSTLGLDDDSWRTPQPARRPMGPTARAASHLRWASGHFLPWIGRRVRGVSSGDGIVAKRPTFKPVSGPIG
jgi:lysophospholipase L1-like esterase